MSFGASVVVGPIVTSFRPPRLAVIRPPNPVCTVISRVPVTVSPRTSAGATMVLPVRAVTGLRTTCTPSVHVSEP